MDLVLVAVSKVTRQDTEILTLLQQGYEVQCGLDSAFPVNRVSNKPLNANNGEYPDF